MLINSAVFKCSSEKLSQCPAGDMLEFAFIGRSNVGKSSLINMLTGRRDLAKVSGTPGKTKLINHFTINYSWSLVDLPGYGYAKISKSAREQFMKMIEDYITKRENLHFLFVLIDSRLEPQKIDLEFIEFLGMKGIPFGLIFTKADKLAQREINRNVSNFKRVLSESWDEIPPVFITSAEKKQGRDEVLDFIGNCLEEREK